MCYFTALRLDVSVDKGLCYTCLGMSPRAILLYLDVSARLYTYMYKGLCCTCSRVNVCFFVLHMHVRVCIQELFATPGRFCLAPGTPGFARSTHKLFGLFRKTTDWVEERAGKFKIACYSPFAFKKKTVNQETNNNCPLLAKEGLPAPIAVNEAHYQSCSWSSSATKPPQQPQAT